MERKSHLNVCAYAVGIAALLMATSASATSRQLLAHSPTVAPNNVITFDSQTIAIPEEYQNNEPQPLMRGEGFNYNLYYNYRLTPHLILRPNVQKTTKPGSVSDSSHPFVGGLSAGINF
ncbi:carbohydrate porin [Erwinia sorbitola]|uniref:Porin n=1 Tax=Erwinia sorbitola TaxID=2681984 RepID=A0ABW9R9R5_9GAMM|nr:carbohydrate porin [Erwinia sorbitola]MTD26882.1 hypothetical protein [Erwinia sorbitola]